jgi:catechol 2,3-dioxygenase-like lactoylglutathione lyase family enzyme
MHIGELFHVVHVIDDLAAARRWYDRVFAPRYMFEQHYSPVEERDATLAIFADYVVEPVATREPLAEARKPVGRFRARFGQRFHSIAFYTRDVAAIYERLAAHGVRMTGDGGAPLDGPPQRSALYTHPRDTFGLLEFMEPRVGGKGGVAVGDVLGECYDPRLRGDYSPAYWRDEHPLRIQRTSALTVLVRDLAPARELFVDVLEGTLFLEDPHTERDTHSLFVLLGSGSVIELARPLSSDGVLAAELARAGEMLHSVVFRVADLRAAAAHLEACGLSAERAAPFRALVARGATSLWLDPGQALGAVYGFTDRDLPGDPRRA